LDRVEFTLPVPEIFNGHEVFPVNHREKYEAGVDRHVPDTAGGLKLTYDNGACPAIPFSTSFFNAFVRGQ
jgi:hypothetical protein